ATCARGAGACSGLSTEPCDDEFKGFNLLLQPFNGLPGRFKFSSEVFVLGPETLIFLAEFLISLGEGIGRNESQCRRQNRNDDVESGVVSHEGGLPEPK